MAEKWKKWWKSIVIGLVIIGVLAFLVFIVINRNEPWTGFGELPKSDTTIPAKTLWDWLDLFVVSFVVALALFWLNTSQRRREEEREEKREELERDQEDARRKREKEQEDARRKREKEQEDARRKQEDDRQIDNQRQATLLDYYDKMSKLILEQKLGDEDNEVSNKAMVVARALTLSTFRNLDPGRNAAVLRFLGDARLADKILHYGDMSGIDFKNSNQFGAHLSGAKLGAANFSGAILTWAKLKNTNLMKTNLSGADLHGADLSDAFLLQAILTGANLSGAHLSRTNLTVAKLGWVDLNDSYMFAAELGGAILTGAKLNDVDLSMAGMIVADLSMANLRRANLRGADLREANLLGADLTMANLSDADLSGAKYTTDTIWPDGFKLKEAGAILVDEEGNPIEDSDEEE